MAMADAFINPSILTWARKRADVTVPVIAAKIRVKPEQILLWERGEKRPTLRQAQLFAHKTNIPLGYLYLRTPPKEELLLPDLRTIGDHPAKGYSAELRDTLRMTLERQEWYREYSLHNDYEPLSWPGTGDLEDFDGTLALLHELLEGETPRPTGFENYYSQLRSQIEALGVLIMRNSVVGNNVHRRLDRNEFRGFAISDDRAPVIFINTADTPQAQIFTLLHEFSHLLLGQSGVSDLSPHNLRKIERFCNRLAAEFLVPSQDFIELWRSDFKDWQANLPVLARHFHVSQWVIARRALEHKLISERDYWAHYHLILEFLKKQSTAGTGPPFNRLIKTRYGNRLITAITSEALSGRMLLRDASRLIGVRPEKIKAFAKKELGF